MLTKREVFEKVKAHLLTQMAQAFDYHGCAYRGEGGTKCAVGCLIKDEVYTSTLEGDTVNTRRVHAALEASGIDVDPDMEEMLSALQNMHDAYGPQNWEFRLAVLEKEFFGEQA